MSERQTLWVLRLAGSAVLVLFLISTALAPNAPVPEHVFGILGRPGSAERGMVAVRMRLATWVDCVFLLAYPLIYVGIAFLLAAHGRLRRRMVTVMIVLAVAMAVGDALENRELLGLMREVDPFRMGPALRRLRIFTLVKWYALYAASALVTVHVWREGGWWRWSAVFFGLAALLGLAAIFYLPAIEWSVAPLGIAWTMTYVRAFRP